MERDTRNKLPATCDRRQAGGHAPLVAGRDGFEGSAEFFDRMLAGAALCEILCDDEGRPSDFRYLQLNLAFEKILGLKREAVIGKTARELFPGIEPMWVETYGRIALEGTCERFEGYLGPLNRHFEVSAYCPAKGRFVAIFLDITERIKMERTLHENEERYRMLVENSQDIVCELDRGGRYLYLSPNIAAVLGYEPCELIGKCAFDLLHPEDLPKVLEKFALPEAIASYRCRHKNGSWRWFESASRFFKTPDGKEQAVVISRDITERLATEQRLWQLSRAVEQSPVSVVITDTKGDIEYVNPKFSEVTGYAFEEVIGKNPRILKSGDLSAEEYKRLWATITAGDDWHGEFRNKRKNGELYWESASISPVTDRNGAITHFIAVKEDITESKRVAEVLSESEERYRHLVESSPDTIFIGCEGRFAYVNPAGLKLFGATSPDQILGRSVLDFIHPEDRETLQARIMTVRKERKRAPLLELRYLRLDGSVVEVEETANPFQFNGKPAAQVIVHDITERKRAVEALRESEERFRAICETSPLGIFLTDGNGDNVYANAAHREILGMTHEELVGKGWRNALHPDDRERVLGEWDEFRQNHEPFQSVRRYVHKDGRVVWVTIAAAPIWNGEMVCGYVGLAQDITEQRRAMTSTMESEERFRQLAENLHGVFRMSTADQTKILYVSPAYEEIWGRTCLSLRQNPASWLEAIHPEDRGRVGKNYIARQSNETFDETYRIVRPDGSTRWIRGRSFAIRDAHGKVYRVAEIAEDITERKRLDEQFLRSQRMESIGTLASGVAHDLNNILAPILMSANMLREEISPDLREEMLSMIEECANRGSSIIRQVLTFARGVEGERSVLQMRHLVGELEKITRETFPKSINIVTRIPRDLWPVTGDATQLHQMLLNLCINARDAMPDGGTLKISAENVELDANYSAMASEAKPGSYVKLTVSDSGCGIPTEIITKIFDPFFTTKAVGKGTGLGLSTVMGIAKGHGGFVNVYSEVRKGTTFKVYVPATLDASAVADRQTAPLPPIGSGETVLVVDDEAPISIVLERLLKKSGYNVLVAANGVEAMSLCTRHAAEIRVVLTDIMMPLMDGVNLTRALKKMNPRLEVIASTGQADEARQAVLKSLGVKIFLQKPYVAGKLLNAVHDAIHGGVEGA